GEDRPCPPAAAPGGDRRRGRRRGGGGVLGGHGRRPASAGAAVRAAAGIRPSPGWTGNGNRAAPTKAPGAARPGQELTRPRRPRCPCWRTLRPSPPERLLEEVLHRLPRLLVGGLVVLHVLVADL